MSSVWRAAGQTAPAAVLLLALLASSPVALAQTPPRAPESADGRSVEQSRLQVTLSPGSAAEGELRFTYDGSEPTIGHLAVLDYQILPSGERFDLPASATADGRQRPSGADKGLSAANWTSITPGSLALRPSATETVRYQVQVPPTAPPGDHSALVLLETEGGGPRAGVRLIISVPGEARRQGRLDGFGAHREPLQVMGLELPFALPLYSSGPIKFSVQLQNTGNVHFTTTGKVLLADALGNQVASLDLPAGQVFPGDTGTLTGEWSAPAPFGLFSARLELGGDGPWLSATDHFVVMPWQQLLAALLVALALWLLLGRRLSLPLPQTRPRPKAAPAQAHVGEPAAERPPVADAGTGIPAAAPAASQAAGPPSYQQTPFASRTVLPSGTVGHSSVPDLVRWGQEAARAGDRAVAYRLFVRALQLEESNEDAWLWRAGTSASQDEALDCLRRVLQINPGNARARRGVEELEGRSVRS